MRTRDRDVLVPWQLLLLAAGLCPERGSKPSAGLDPRVRVAGSTKFGTLGPLAGPGRLGLAESILNWNA